MKVRCTFRKPGIVDMWFGWSLDATLRTSIGGEMGIELRCKSVHLDGGELLHGWRLHKYLGTWIHVRQDVDGSDTSIGCRWYTIIVILIEVKYDLNCVNLVLGGDGMQILRLGSEMGPGLGWDTHLETWICSGGTRMKLRSNSLDVCVCVCVCGGGGGGGGPALRWVATWMDVRR